MSPDIVGRLRSPRLASAPATPNPGEMYYSSTSNTLFWWNGAAWVSAMGGVAGLPPSVSSLPGSPVDGQECYYVADATNGIVWHLKYRAGSASARKWEFVGGSELFAAPSGSVTTTVASALTGGPTVTVPLVGDYDVTWGCDAYSNQAGVTALYVYMAKGGTNVGLPPAMVQAATTSSGGVTVGTQLLSVAASDVLTLNVANTLGVSCIYQNGWIRLRPRRVG